MLKNCEICGEPLGDVHGLRQYCYECAEARRREQNRIACAARNGMIDVPNKICRYCGAEMPSEADARKRCPNCINAPKPAPKPREKKKPAAPRKRTKPRRHCWDLEHKSTTQVAVEAAALNLSYGQYSSMVDSLMIERYLESQGIYDGLERTDRAWQAFKKQRKAERRRDEQRQREYKEAIF